MINSHYIPQFILRNFYDDGKITYCDLKDKTVEPRNTRSVFSEEGYYPEGIEKDLCKKAEYLFANLFHNKLENAGNSITLTVDELFVLKKYLIVSAIRYKYEFTDEEKKLAEMLGPAFQVDFDKNLNSILACNNMEEIFNLLVPVCEYLNEMLLSKEQQLPDDLNIHLCAELKDIMHSYVVFVKTRNSEQFLIPDIGRGVFQGPLCFRKPTFLLNYLLATRNPQISRLIPLISARDYSIYPLTKNLAIITIDTFYKLFTDSEFSVPVSLPEDCPTISSAFLFGDRNTIKPPKVRFHGQDKEYRYEIKQLSSKDVCLLNCLMMAQAKRFIACSNLKSIQKTLEEIDKYSERDYSFMRL